MEITQENFESEVLKASGPVIADFWAPWCGPCKALAPILEKIGREHPEFKVAKINTDDCPDLASTYGIGAIPTLLFFHNGVQVKKTVGMQNEAQILKTLEEIVSAATDAAG